MRGPRATNIPMLLTAGLLLIGGAIRLAESDAYSGAALLAGGLMVMGGWTALEASAMGHWLNRIRRKEKDDQDDEEED